MGVPSWWGRRRFGMFVHANLATVPAWSPIGEYADWYRSHLGDPVPDVLLHPTPLVEVLAHHRERWGHVASMDDFWPLLTFDSFDADEWAELARDAGMGYTVLVTKHHDGLCWWDAPNTERTVLHEGPRRNVLAEFAAACDRADLVFGTYYSLLDWGDPRYPGDDYVDEILHPHVLDLVERYGTAVLWGDGHWGHGPDRWRTATLIDRARAIRPDIVVNDRWWAEKPDIVTMEYQTPDGIVDRPWELCRGVGHSFCHNRAERLEHFMTGHDIVSLLTEVVAKGGNLLLNVGPAADGTIPELQAVPIHAAGAWVTRHADVIDGAVPWEHWGDQSTRYTVTAGGLNAIDVGRSGTFAHLGSAAGKVRSVDAADGSILDWEQDDRGLRIRRLDRTPPGLAPVYRIVLEAPASAPVELFDADRHGAAEPVPLSSLLDGTRAGQLVQLGEGRYIGPAHVPDGVTVRGLGPARTVIDGAAAAAITLGTDSRVEHVTIEGGGERIAWFPVPVVRINGPGAAMLGCVVRGHVIVSAHRAKIRACDVFGVVARGVDGVVVSRSRVNGMRWDVGIDLTDGAGHLVDSCEIVGHLCAVRFAGTIASTVRGCTVRARWWGVHLAGCDGTAVIGNDVGGTMRAADVDGGTLNHVEGNVVHDGDSGCIVERGASQTVVAGNRWERCRIGVLAWDVGDISHRDNAAVDLHEPEHTVAIGPA